MLPSFASDAVPLGQRFPRARRRQLRGYGTPLWLCLAPTQNPRKAGNLYLQDLTGSRVARVVDKWSLPPTYMPDVFFKLALQPVGRETLHTSALRNRPVLPEHIAAMRISFRN